MKFVGESDPIVLEFDHLRDKSCNVSRMTNANIEKIKEEVAKCRVLCSNCHARETAKKQGWYKWLDYSRK